MLAVWQATIVDNNGTVQPSAQVEVRLELTGALAALFVDRDGAIAKPNPFDVTSEGFARFYVAGGAYQIKAYTSGFERIHRHVAVGLLAENDTISGEMITGVPHTEIEYAPTTDENTSGTTVTLLYEPPLRVTRYGTTWDAIQRALNVADEGGGGHVHMPAGRYTKGTANTIHMRGNVKLTGDGYASEIFVPAGATFTDNILKFESIAHSSVSDIRINGNRSGVSSGTQYGVYFGSADQCQARNCYLHSTTGDGLHFYDSDGCLAEGNILWDNFFHGLEIEQCRDTMAIGNNCHSNLRHGIYVFEGEVAASGSHGITLTGNTCAFNDQSGIVIQGPLSDQITAIANVCRENAERGMMVFDQVKGVVLMGNVISLNGHYGIYLWRIRDAIIQGNRLHNNGQALHAGYQEIMLEGDATAYTISNAVLGNSILIDGATKCAYAIKESSANDGPNIVQGNIVPNAGSAGRIGLVHETGTQTSYSLSSRNLGVVQQNRGTATFNGTGAQVAFVIAHGLTPDEPRNVHVTAGSPDASGAFSTAVDVTNITVTYGSAPVLGTGNVVLRWSATI